ncbi:MAG: CRISPR-associated endonuclease Cas3'' [Enterobacterales bacterium]|nr:CRISPR-associated endonuclease Cas3'' [Enterobacterales bacterium]
MYQYTNMEMSLEHHEKEYIAHVRKEDGSEVWATSHELSEHLLATAQLTKTFAQCVGSDWAELAGRWHDLGKYRKRFQDYIRIQSGYEAENAHIENGKRAPHSTAGAIHAVKQLPSGEGLIIAYLIAGHHAGLPDWSGGKGSLNHRLHDGLAEYQEALIENIPDNILIGDGPTLPRHINKPEALALWMRILFSCLVDADFLDTERYMQPKRFADRQAPAPLDKLQSQFFDSMAKLQNNSVPSPLNTIRNTILKQCTDAAKLRPGLFSLTVPTGGGKTLSSLAFALKHAQVHNKKRIIYAIPFTSIIEQNADVFRKFLEDDNAVLEHHSNFDVTPTKENSRARLATENWNAPLIVTTNVQLFESLHASRTSRCRKLHNIVNSIIILDEAQQIPRDFHAPITRVMQQLSDYYGVTWVLCTATQPVLKNSSNAFGKTIFEGLNDVREIIDNPVALAETLNRVKVHLPFDKQVTSWTALAEKIEQENCALVIVNTRKQARMLCELLPDNDSTLHLSANMCAQHRSILIKDIKNRLQQKTGGGS